LRAVGGDGIEPIDDLAFATFECPARSLTTFGRTPEARMWAAWAWRRSWKWTRSRAVAPRFRDKYASIIFVTMAVVALRRRGLIADTQALKQRSMRKSNANANRRIVHLPQRVFRRISGRGSRNAADQRARRRRDMCKI